MPYTVINNLLGGVDRSRPIYALDPGSLWQGINGHLTRGGDFEKRKAFVQYAILPAGTFGLERASGSLYVFGSMAAPAMPPGVLYQRLAHPEGSDMVQLLSTDVYGGKVYAVALFADGSIVHFYDGAVVGDWLNGVIRASMNNIDGIVLHLASLVTDPTYTVTTSPTEVIFTHNTVNVPFTLIAGTVNVTGGVDDQTCVASLVTPAGVADAEVRKITIGGTFEAGDRFGFAIDGVNYGALATPTPMGTVVKTHGRKMYAGSGRLVNFSGVDDATLWDRDDNPGAGFEDVSIHESTLENVTALGKYLRYLAVFSENTIQIWDMREDETDNAPLQTIGETGTRSPRTVRNFGDLDTFYLSESGIRSLRTRTQIDVAGVNDVGTPIDPLVQAQIAASTDAEIEAASSAVDPQDARFWMALRDKIFVFTYFASKKVSGWTWYEPGFDVDEMVTLNRRVYLRSNDTIYVYGGTDGETYDSCRVTVQLPFLAAGKPGTWKDLTGVDIATQGEWDVDLLMDPNDLNQMVRFGTLTNVTFHEEDTAGLGRFTHAAPRFINEAAGPASISAVCLYYTQGESES